MKLLLLPIFIIFSNCSNPKTEEKDLSKTVADINKNCPQVIDSETKFDGLDFIKPNTLIYKFTLLHVMAQNVDTLEFKKALLPGILSTIKISPEMKQLRDNDTKINYAYYDKMKLLIYTFRFSKEDYK